MTTFRAFDPIRRPLARAVVGVGVPPVATASSTPWGAIGLGAAALGVLGIYLYSRRAGDVPAIVKGRDVTLVMTDGRALSIPASHGILHDPSGRELPQRYVYVGPFRRTSQEVELDARGREYLGSDYSARAATFDVPSSNAWRSVGDAIQIIYMRDRGQYAARIPYEHTFARPVPVDGAGSWKRIDLGTFGRANWRGFVSP